METGIIEKHKGDEVIRPFICKKEFFRGGQN